jgi:twitching motility two-component system response regulator PilH
MANNIILVVDDSKTDYLYVKKILDQGGYTVAYADSGEKALEEAKRLSPDCILMDVVMPDMNGFQATRALSRDAATQNIPVIMLSSKSEKTDRVWAERQGATDYVVKPASPKELLTKVMAVIGA